MPRKKKVEYYGGVGLTNEQAQRYGEYIQQFAHLDDEALAETLVDNRIGSPIEDFFTADIKEAAYKQWKNEAMFLLRKIYKKVGEDEDGNPILERAFFSIVVQTEVVDDGIAATKNVRMYKPVDEIMANADLRKSLLAQALSELKAFKKKYGRLKELAAVFAEIDKLG